MLVRVLERTGATVRAQGSMYKAVVQLVILYGIEIWVLNREMLKILEGFHHQVERRITRMTEKSGTGRE